MKRKDLLKELKLAIIQSIEETLNKHNAEAAKKIRKTTLEASKKVAKKISKALQEITTKSTVKNKTNKAAKKPQQNASSIAKARTSKNKTLSPSNTTPFKKLATTPSSAAKVEKKPAKPVPTKAKK